MYIHTKGFEVIVTNDYKSNNNKTKTKKKGSKYQQKL